MPLGWANISWTSKSWALFGLATTVRMVTSFLTHNSNSLVSGNFLKSSISDFFSRGMVKALQTFTNVSAKFKLMQCDWIITQYVPLHTAAEREHLSNQMISSKEWQNQFSVLLFHMYVQWPPSMFLKSLLHWWEVFDIRRANTSTWKCWYLAQPLKKNILLLWMEPGRMFLLAVIFYKRKGIICITMHHNNQFGSMPVKAFRV